jgi:hypothetical protein
LNLKNYKNRKELEQFTEQLFNTNLALKEKVEHLEKLLLESMPEISLEERLLMREIENMDRLSQSGNLSIDETKQLKMLCDSLVAIRKSKPQVVEEKKNFSDVDPSKLLKLVKDGDK